MTLPPGRYGPPPHPTPSQQVFTQHRPAGHGGGGGGGGDGTGFFDAFDFGFESYATPAVVKVLYGIVLFLAVAGWIGGTLLMFALFLPPQDLGLTRIPGTPLPGILTLALGWIPALLMVLGARLGVEQCLATVRTAIDVRALRVRYVGPVSE